MSIVARIHAELAPASMIRPVPLPDRHLIDRVFAGADRDGAAGAPRLVGVKREVYLTCDRGTTRSGVASLWEGADGALRLLDRDETVARIDALGDATLAVGILQVATSLYGELAAALEQSLDFDSVLPDDEGLNLDLWCFRGGLAFSASSLDIALEGAIDEIMSLANATLDEEGLDEEGLDEEGLDGGGLDGGGDDRPGIADPSEIEAAAQDLLPAAALALLLPPVPASAHQAIGLRETCTRLVADLRKALSIEAPALTATIELLPPLESAYPLYR